MTVPDDVVAALKLPPGAWRAICARSWPCTSWLKGFFPWPVHAAWLGGRASRSSASWENGKSQRDTPPTIWTDIQELWDGGLKILAWGGDLFPFQAATVFYSNKLAGDKTKAVNFMKGYVKSSRYYFDNVLAQKVIPLDAAVRAVGE